MTSTITVPQTCPTADLHGNPFRYCPTCSWSEEVPAPTSAEAELTSLILGRTATSAAKAILTAGYRKADLPEATPCCGASEACRDCPTD